MQWGAKPNRPAVTFSNATCIVLYLVPRHAGPPSGAPAGSPGMHRDPPPARPGNGSRTGPGKSRSGGVSARCHAKVPPKDRIFWRTRGSRHGGGVLTCGSPEPAARPIRPIDENPILWRDFAPGRADRGTSHGASGRASQSIVHKLDECAHPAFFERLRAMRVRDVPCTRPTRDALRHTPTPHAAPPTHRTSRAANRSGPAAQRTAGPPWQVIIPSL